MNARRITSILVVLLASHAHAEPTTPNPCRDAPQPYQCLVENLTAYYAADPQGFFNVFNAQAHRAQACKSSADASLFLRIHGSTGVDGEIAEAVADETIKLALQQPACLLRASEHLSGRELDHLALYLRDPLLYPYEPIEASLASVEGVDPMHPLLVRLGAK